MDQPGTLKPSAAVTIGTHAGVNGSAPAETVLHAQTWRDLTTPDVIAEWDALAASAAQPNPFYESWYLLASLEALDPQGEVRLLILRAAGQMVGLLPVRRESSYYGYPVPHWRNWAHANCFLGQPLVIPGNEPAFWRAALDWFDRQGGLPMFLHLAHCPLEGPLHSALTHELQARKRAAATVLREDRAALASSVSPDEYLDASLSTKKRKELRRQHRRLAELGDLQFERQQDAANIASWVEEFLALEQRGWKGQAGSALASDTRTAALFAQALDGAAVRQRLERLTLRLDGRPIAMLANFLAPPGAFSFKTAFDEAYARFSPGVLLQRENLAILQRDSIAWVDSCAAQDHPMIDHFWREKRPIARHSIAIGGALRQAAFQLLCRRETGAAPQGLA